MRRELVISTLDQGLTSAFSLALSLAFIALATPEEFGRFAIVQAALMAAHSLQGPLVLTPTNLLLPGRDREAQASQLSMLSSINALVVVAAGCVGLIAALAYIGGTGTVLAAAGLFAIAVVREHSRTVFFAQGNALRVLAQDVIYIAVAGAGIALLWTRAGPFMAALSGMAAASLVAWLLVRPSLRFAPARLGDHLRSYAAVWRDTRWALAGAMQTEAQTRGYLYITEAWHGAASVGVLQAGRLFLSPLWLAVGAWARVARPAMVAAFHRGNALDAYRILGGGVLGVAAMTLLYGTLLALAWPLVEPLVFGGRYGDMGGIVALWWLHGCVYCLNGCISSFVQSRRQFRRLAGIIAVSASTSLAALGAMSLTDLPTVWALYVLIGAELIMLVGLVWTAMRGWPGLADPRQGIEASQGGAA